MLGTTTALYPTLRDPHHGERSEQHRQSFRPCHQAGGQGHSEAHSPGVGIFLDSADRATNLQRY